MAPSSLHIALLWDLEGFRSSSSTPLHGALRITAALHPHGQRAPLDLVACIDVSGSMQGLKLQRARESVAGLVSHLGPNDRLAIVGFAGRIYRVLKPTHMDSWGKDRALLAATGLHALDRTNISGALIESLRVLQESARPSTGVPAVRRVLLFTDGHANTGVLESDRTAWEALSATRGPDIGVSWLGFGEDHDARFLAGLAELCGGNYHRAADADGILDGFAQELGGLVTMVAQDIRVRLNPESGLGPIALASDLRAIHDGNGMAIQRPDIFADERFYIVFSLPEASTSLRAANPGTRVLDVEVSWTDVLTGASSSVRLTATLGDGALDPQASREVREALLLAAAATAQRRAMVACEQGAFMEAQRIVRDAAALAANEPGERAAELTRLLLEVAHRFRSAAAYRDSRAEMSSLHTSLSRARTSGSSIDHLFRTETQIAEIRRFRAELESSSDLMSDTALRRFRGPKQ